MGSKFVYIFSSIILIWKWMCAVAKGSRGKTTFCIVLTDTLLILRMCMLETVQHSTVHFRFTFFLDKPIPHSTLRWQPSHELLFFQNVVQYSAAERGDKGSYSGASCQAPPKKIHSNSLLSPPRPKGEVHRSFKCCWLVCICVCKRRGISSSCAVYRICHRPERGKRSDGWCGIAVWNNEFLSCFVL